MTALLGAALCTAGPIYADEDEGDGAKAGFVIKEAKWDSGKRRLKVEGRGVKDHTVTVVNAFAMAQVLGSDRVDDEWKVQARRPAPVPCRVKATQSDGQTAERDVEHAPADCSPKAPGEPPPPPPPPPANVAPTCTIDTPPGNVSITAGDRVSFTGTATDPDGTIAGFSWDFTGGTPASASVEDPGNVTYGSAGTFTASFQATDNNGASCPAATRTVTVTAVAPPPPPPPPPANDPPVCTITAPASGATFNVGDTVGFSATATDPNGDALGVSWGFPGGSPASASQTSASVTYAAAGTKTATFTAAETGTAQGLSCQASVSINIAGNQAQLITDPVAQEPRVNAGFVVLAANDLGMHCADLDYQIFSILPPFNVAHAQVIQRGSLPSIVGPGTVSVVYSAAANSSDPALATPPAAALSGTPRAGLSINSTSQNDALAGVFKNNFWDVNPDTGNIWGFDSYGVLYPAGTDFGGLTPDLGIPVPDPAALPAVTVGQQAMPGIGNPYLANAPQAFDRFDTDLPFFAGLPFGTTVRGINWFAADAIPASPVDDAGRGNAYPLFRIQARQGNNVVASTDIVLPVASEADCQGCHVDPLDCADPSLPAAIQAAPCNGSAVSPTRFSNTTFTVETIGTAPGKTPEQRLLNAAKINIVRLHDAKHGASYTTDTGAPAPCNAANAGDPSCLINQTPIQCSQCHYSPALDLLQAGPSDEQRPDGRGRQQTRHISMSRAMHGVHGQFSSLFPPMPGPVGRSTAQRDSVLEQTCYQCHPGKRTQCLRGAMFNGGMVCQDCHGGMLQVGDDFSAGLPGGQGPDFNKRVPWATEPKCESCHTGDARSPNHSGGMVVAPDGIRLLQAWVDGDANARPIESPSSRFAVDPGTLYRLSTGHKGVMCEGCHGSTHAIWPAANPGANDNVAANQLQGHAGTIVECTTCHASVPNESTTLGGPHGMHAVGDTSFARGGHKPIVGNGNTCRACHGNTGQGTVLSRLPIARRLDGKNFPAGHQVTCGDCHGNVL